MGVVNDGYFRAVNFKRLGDFGYEMSGRDEIYVVNARVFELFENIGKFARRNFSAPLRTRKGIILAERAAERTTRKKNRSRAVFSAYRRLLDHVRVKLRYPHNVLFAARARFFGSVCFAV